MKNRLLSAAVITMLIVISAAPFSSAGLFGSDEMKSEINFKGSSTLAPVISKLSDSFRENYQTWDNVNKDFAEEDIEIFISAGGSGAGVKSVIDGVSDFGMVSRNVAEDEKSSIEEYKEYKLGVDALTVSINPNNKVNQLKDSLSTEEIKNIFSGEYKYWDDLDSQLAHKEIIVITRDLAGGAHKVFQKKIMGDVDVKSSAVQAPSMGALCNKIMENEFAIGYASVGVVNRNKGKIVPMKIDGIVPSKENIVSGSYKISRPLLVIRSGKLSPIEDEFMNYLLSKESASVIEEMGFVPAN
ncbi:MAG: phosphate ABC transporter substrate-binding protein [Bacillota bacterium]